MNVLETPLEIPLNEGYVMFDVIHCMYVVKVWIGSLHIFYHTVP